jgi:hypothetical protein
MGISISCVTFLEGTWLEGTRRDVTRLYVPLL